MKKVLLAVVIGIVMLASVLVFNTLNFTSRQITVEAIKPVDVNQDQVAQHLAEAIRFETRSQDDGTVNAEALLGLHAYLEQTFPNVHARLTREIVNGYSLLYTWPGRDPSLKPMLFSAHLDVVPAEGVWEQPPFAGHIADGFIWGRGAMDDKANVLGVLEAAEMLVKQGVQPERTIYLAFGHDEEIGGKHGAAKIAELLRQRQVALEFVLDEGFFITDGIVPGVAAPVALVGIAEKGILNVALSVDAAGGHASVPPPQTAIGILSAAIQKLEARPMPGGINGVLGQMFDGVGPEMPFVQRLIFANLWLSRPLVERQLAASPNTNALMRTTLAVTLIEGGVKENVLPDHASAVVNVRMLPGDNAEAVLAHLRETIDDPRVRISQRDTTFNPPSAISATDAFGYVTLNRTIRQVFPEVLVAPGQVVGGTDSRHYAALAQNTYRFLPLRLRAEDVARLHGRNERISVESYAACVQFYYQLIRAV